MQMTVELNFEEVTSLDILARHRRVDLNFLKKDRSEQSYVLVVAKYGYFLSIFVNCVFSLFLFLKFPLIKRDVVEKTQKLTLRHCC